MSAWTKDDVKTMRGAAREGRTARWVGVLLGKSRGAVAFKAMRLGIQFKGVIQPKGVQKRLGRKRIRTGSMTVTL